MTKLQGLKGKDYNREGKVRYGVALWLLGVPLPFVIIALFIKGCDW